LRGEGIKSYKAKFEATTGRDLEIIAKPLQQQLLEDQMRRVVMLHLLEIYYYQ
jgi:hypothetical protein